MIHLSAAAIQEVIRLRAKHPSSEPYLRLGVQPGGCADLFYTLGFDDTPQTTDQVYDCDGIPVVIDPQSLNLLKGLRLDYSEDLMGGGFRFHNPNATQSCGCGNSFSVQPPDH